MWPHIKLANLVILTTQVTIVLAIAYAFYHLIK